MAAAAGFHDELDVQTIKSKGAPTQSGFIY
jgi:hypothetical protein